jgi:hypothetical protein
MLSVEPPAFQLLEYSPLQRIVGVQNIENSWAGNSCRLTVGDVVEAIPSASQGLNRGTVVRLPRLAGTEG